MVTARMSETKKAAGNRVLKDLGMNASQLINEVYDYLISHKESPLKNTSNVQVEFTPEEIEEAKKWAIDLADSCAYISDETRAMSAKELRKERLDKKYKRYMSTK